MVNVFDVAYYVLDKCGKMSTFKLHKLLYYCQAWYMSWNAGTPLFKEDFEAWVNGPVIRELFNIHKGMYEISKDDIVGYKEKDLNVEQKENMDKILFFYRKQSPLSLVLKSHAELPWKKARDGINSMVFSDNIISKKNIYEYYRNKSIESLSME